MALSSHHDARPLRISRVPSCQLSLSCSVSRLASLFDPAFTVASFAGLFHWLLTKPSPVPQIFREETFGPAIPLFRFSSEAEAIQLANDTEYGLASYFFTKVGCCGSSVRGTLCRSRLFRLQYRFQHLCAGPPCLRRRPSLVFPYAPSGWFHALVYQSCIAYVTAFELPWRG